MEDAPQEYDDLMNLFMSDMDAMRDNYKKLQNQVNIQFWLLVFFVPLGLWKIVNLIIWLLK